MRMSPFPARRRPGPRGGAASVELAFLALPLGMILFGVWEVGRYIYIDQTVSNAAREGGRQASVGKYTEDEVKQAVLDYLENANLHTKGSDGTVNVTVVVKNASSASRGSKRVLTGTDAEVAKSVVQNDELTVEVTYPFKNSRWLATTYFLADDASLHVKTDWRSQVDVPVKVTQTIPQRPLK